MDGKQLDAESWMRMYATTAAGAPFAMSPEQQMLITWFLTSGVDRMMSQTSRHSAIPAIEPKQGERMANEHERLNDGDQES